MATTTSLDGSEYTFENGILYVRYKKGTVLNKEFFLKAIEVRKTLTKDATISILVDMRNGITASDDGLELAAENPSPEHVKGIAILTNEGETHILAKLYTIFDHPNINSKVFLSEEEARNWLASL